MQLPTLPPELLEITACNLRQLIERVRASWLPQKKYGTIEWMEQHFRIPKQDSDVSGLYDADYVPYFWGVAYALDNETVEMVVLMKAAQIGWTLLETGWIAKRVCTQPSRMLALFPKDETARSFMEEKFEPTIESSPELAKRIDISSSRKSGNRSNYKNFPGGSFKVFGSNSVSNVKSTPAPVVIVEEPDDTNTSVGDQGSAIALVRERIKRFRRKKIVLGGTPSVKDFSIIESHAKLSTQRVLPITCHECGEKHVLDWENVSWLDNDSAQEHPVFKRAMPETAVYSCPHCAVVWSDYQRKQNIINTCIAARDGGDPWCGWIATVNAPEAVEGFTELSELYVCMAGTSLADVVRAYLEAEHKAESGDESERIVFQNSKLAKAYEFSSKDQLDADQLEELAEDYDELVCPAGGLIVTAGVDVQDDRLAVVIRAWGRAEESWLLYWGELVGNTVDKKDPVWTELDTLLFSGFDHERFGKIDLSTVSIDSSDGGTNEAVYTWVRTRSKPHKKTTLMAIKGDSHDNGIKPIFSKPRSIEHKSHKRHTKANKHGLHVYLVGTHKAKDLISRRLSGTSAFMHSYKAARPDYWKQVTAETKVPNKRLKGDLTWQCRAGRRNEATDCEVYALHGAMAIKLNTYSAKQWDDLELGFAQNDLFIADKKIIEQPQKPALDEQPTERVHAEQPASWLDNYTEDWV
ncbi:phage terminase large subunit family protein [Marinagarivorans algicola]|uniref:phage terminase large subunit family protein n=1 Tax=Marinagarivorans algicola TaxID=1513270 RepID=UPI003736D37B